MCLLAYYLVSLILDCKCVTAYFIVLSHYYVHAPNVLARGNIEIFPSPLVCNVAPCSLCVCGVGL